MGIERLREIAEKLREMANFASSDYIYLPVEVEDEDYEFDLGDFGYRSATVRIERDEYSFDAAEVLERFPVSAGSFEEFADILDEEVNTFEEKEESTETIEAVLDRMEAEEGELVTALRAVLGAFRKTAEKVAAIIDLPSRPFPWPGALRTDIDYTAADFPLRYQPPPGYDWTKREKFGESYRVSPAEAEAYDVEFLRAASTGYMIMDKKGRISWRERGDDDLANGKRWSIWFMERDGIPMGPGAQGATTPPIALDQDGVVIEGGAAPSWSTSLQKKATDRLRAIMAEFEGSAPVLNEYGVSYDPLNVEVSSERSYSDTEDLRVGDYITGNFGRVLSVRRKPGEPQFVVRTYYGPGDIREDERSSFNWEINRLIGVDRESQPTALSISERETSGAPYDPLSVELLSQEDGVKTEELRLGEEITGPSFGRVVSVEKLDENNFLIKMVRPSDGFNNVYSGGSEEWAALKLARPDRDSIPAALAMGASTPISAAYDPLKVPLKGIVTTIRAKDLRLGDDITGLSFGRVTRIENDTIYMDRDGKTNETPYTPEFVWGVLEIDVTDRDSVPTAVSLQRVPEPAF